MLGCFPVGTNSEDSLIITTPKTFFPPKAAYELAFECGFAVYDFQTLFSFLLDTAFVLTSMSLRSSRIVSHSLVIPQVAKPLRTPQNGRNYNLDDDYCVSPKRGSLTRSRFTREN